MTTTISGGATAAGQPTGPSAAWAEFVAELKLSSLPQPVRDSGLRAIAAVLVAAREGASEELARALQATLSSLGSAPQATTVGPVSRLGATYAAMVNGTAGRLGVPAHGGPSSAEDLCCSVVPAAVAAGELVGASFTSLVVGVVVGLELALRLASALGGAHTARGWELAGTAGTVGAALGAARVLGLPADKVHAALGFASTQAAGVQAGGSTITALVAGKAAADGLESALLARTGLIGPLEPLEGRRGLLALLTTKAAPTKLTDGLGSVWLVATHAGLGAADGGSTFDALARKLSYGAPIDEVVVLLRHSDQ